jgi:NADH:ubiquinone oxidoreductase subunit 3 (subunit A)
MSDIIFTPPIAFVLYVILVAVLSGIGRVLAGSPSPTPTKTSTYSSGEPPPKEMAAPGYRPFFVVALFFAILHLGVLMLGSNDFSTMAIVYLVGLMLALLALILG